MSHDLRTPLATIEQALDGLESGELELTDEDRLALLPDDPRRTQSAQATRRESPRSFPVQAQAAETRPQVWTIEELVAQALDELPDADRVTLTAPASFHRCASTRCRCSARLRTSSRMPWDRRRRGREHQVDGDATGRADPSDRPRPRHPGIRAGADLRAVPPAEGRRGSRAPASASRSRAGSPRRTAGGCGSSRGRVRARHSSSPSHRRATRTRSGAGAGMTRILVVDDEPQFLRALQTNLRGAGYDVITASTAEEALSSAGLHPPEAVILDLLLPDGRGTDVCRELRKWDGGADHSRFGGRRRGGEDRRPRRGRGRLRDEAVRDRRAPGPPPCGAPPRGAHHRADADHRRAGPSTSRSVP